MNIRFRTYSGLAGDLQMMLIGETNDGMTESRLFTSVGIFKYYNLKRAKSKIIKNLELKTGRKYEE